VSQNVSYRDQLNSWKKCTSSEFFENVFNFSEIDRQFEKFKDISQALLVLISGCYIIVN